MKYLDEKRIADRIGAQILRAVTLWLGLGSLFRGVAQATDPGNIQEKFENLLPGAGHKTYSPFG